MTTENLIETTVEVITIDGLVVNLWINEDKLPDNLDKALSYAETVKGLKYDNTKEYIEKVKALLPDLNAINIKNRYQGTELGISVSWGNGIIKYE